MRIPRPASATWTLLAALVLAPWLVHPPASAASATPEQAAASVPVELAEATTGGTWSDGGRAGTYRVLVMRTGAPGAPQTLIYLQWIAIPAGAAGEIVAAVPVRELNERKLPNAFLSLDSEANNEINVQVQVYDPNSEDSTAYTVKAMAPGRYTVSESSSEE